MSRRSFSALIVGFALVLAACSSSGSSPAASTAASAAVPTAEASTPVSAAPSSGGSPAAGACTETKAAGAVAVSIKDFEFAPPAISAKVGQVVAFSNKGFEPHNATLDAGGCATSTLQSGNSDGLVFTAAGTYPFHCTVHTQMHGTITVTG
jgi:plastocyanin